VKERQLFHVEPGDRQAQNGLIETLAHDLGDREVRPRRRTAVVDVDARLRAASTTLALRRVGQ
jgi:hypothetical protein